ncbi:class I SAM-dependent methyltransferase [Phytoactinopolyspora mesophila]|uniref:class I SAM-dependent methyltransferase n=1 Tax=Phytoactinopolyspora mesophila TaxID=2650750 RepID=UPI0024837364|nr:class I SAM-dependent methyltransferase [Phytoactinopolyspora mesophila]
MDVDTGGGELLASLAPLPQTIATEPYPPNLPVAAKRLAPLGVNVRPGRAEALPVPDAHVDLVLNRHGALDAAEIARVLRPGGVFLTQQVGGRNDIEFNEALGMLPADPDTHSLTTVTVALESAGLVVEVALEEFPRVRYLDVGAVAYQLRLVPWQVPGFDVATPGDRLREIHDIIERAGSFTVHDHRFLIQARKP